MRMFAVLFASLFVSAVAGGQSTGGTWITDVTIVSPEALNHVVKGSVLIEGGRIVRVERKQNLKAPAGAKVVNGDGGFLIPGLIDSHVHLASIPGMGFDQRAANAEMVNNYYKQLPRSYLYFGYTTVVDLMVIDHQMLKDFQRESSSSGYLRLRRGVGLCEWVSDVVCAAGGAIQDVPELHL